ncbi:hypothetical protein M378DRAFT_168449 [Amanita muscaria Koide BX008]|uniref:Uncharacterized protein n=1 Tax=Amanita muscaria (strain Koide BX008) TaxID=946122 RepID=A0A0C2T151_AMAMK|nr:hypothetical protein M378DRAFT_168449 [Amanita muscaria Koide BX008]
MDIVRQKVSRKVRTSDYQNYQLAEAKLDERSLGIYPISPLKATSGYVQALF